MDISKEDYEEEIKKIKGTWNGTLDELKDSVNQLRGLSKGSTRIKFSDLKERCKNGSSCELVDGLEEVSDALEFHIKGGSNILIVEDDKSIRNLMINIFKKKGFKVSYACDGKSAINKLESINYGLVFLDINIPKINGFDLVEHIREKLGLNIEIIIITAMDLSDDEVRFLNVFECMILKKPIDFDTLVKLAIAGSNRRNRKLKGETSSHE